MDAITIQSASSILFDAAWTVFMRENGECVGGLSASRFLLTLFFQVLLYLTIRMRAMLQFKPHQIVALAGCVVFMVKETSLLFLVSSYELGLWYDPRIAFLAPPIDHCFRLVAYACFSWYSIEASQWCFARKLARRTLIAFCTAIASFGLYILITWKAYFTEHMPSHPDMAHFGYTAIDWQVHVVMAIVAAVGVLMSYMRKRCCCYLFWYWVITLLANGGQAIMTAFYVEQPWHTAIFNAMFTWSIPLLMLHFVSSYVLKIGQCIVCKQEEFLNDTYWESMQADASDTSLPPRKGV